MEGKKISFTILGEPQGKARAKVVRLMNGQSHSYTPDKTVLYENLIKTEYIRAADGYKFADDAMLSITVIANCAIPKSVSKKKRELMEAGNVRPTKKPDSDNILKVVSDALNGIAYRDDAQIVSATIAKLYSAQPNLTVYLQEVTGDA